MYVEPHVKRARYDNIVFFAFANTNANSGLEIIVLEDWFATSCLPHDKKTHLICTCTLFMCPDQALQTTNSIYHYTVTISTDKHL